MPGDQQPGQRLLRPHELAPVAFEQLAPRPGLAQLLTVADELEDAALEPLERVPTVACRRRHGSCFGAGAPSPLPRLREASV